MKKILILVLCTVCTAQMYAQRDLPEPMCLTCDTIHSTGVPFLKDVNIWIFTLNHREGQLLLTVFPEAFRPLPNGLIDYSRALMTDEQIQKTIHESPVKAFQEGPYNFFLTRSGDNYIIVTVERDASGSVKEVKRQNAFDFKLFRKTFGKSFARFFVLK